MSKTVSDCLVERLLEWNVRQIYGYPGDGINGILGALQRADAPRFVQVRHEEAAAFMACAHAKLTGRPGVCLATSGPGAIHLLNGLYDAKLDHQPVLAIVGQQARTALGGHYQQEVDLQTLFKDVASEYIVTVMSPQQLPGVIDRALRIAFSQQTVTCIIVPADLQEEEYEPPQHAFKQLLTSPGYARPRAPAPDELVQRAAQVLNEGRRVAILIGQGARDAADEVLEVAELTGAGIAKALLGKDVLPDDLPFVTGAIGLLGTRPSYDMMMGCDTLLMIGSSFPYSQFLPRPGQARGIQIDIDPRMIGIRYPMELHLAGDARQTLRALIPLLRRKSERGWQERITGWVDDWWRTLEAQVHIEADPINPQLVFWELSSRLPERCIVTCDSGSGTNWYARELKLREGMRGTLAGTLATMGCAVPYAIAAKITHPDRPVVACVGDGAMQMNGLNELLTAARYWREWDDPRLIFLVLHNNDLNQVTWEMRAMAGDPRWPVSQDLPDFDYAAYARLLGFEGIRMERPEQVVPGWEAALRADRPVVVDALTDPDVPPLPPHITFDQAAKLTRALLKGDPDAPKILRQSFAAKVKELLT